MKWSGSCRGAVSASSLAAVALALALCVPVSPIAAAADALPADQRAAVQVYAGALATLKGGGRKEAMALLERLGAGDFMLADYAAFDLASLFHDSGDDSSTIGVLDRLSGAFRKSLVEKRANQLWFRAACRDPSSENCAAALARFSSRKLPREFAVERMSVEARRLEAQGHLVQAYRMYQKIYLERPLSPLAEESRKATVRLRKTSDPETAASFHHATFGERMKRVEKLMNGFRFSEAAAGLKNILSIGYAPKHSVEAQYLLGRALDKARKREAARKAFEELIARYPSHKRAVRGQYEIARIDWNLDRDKASVKRLEKLIASGPGREMKRNSLILLGKIFEARREFGRAKKRYNEALGQRPGAATGESLRWRLSWIEYLQGRYGQAARLFARAASKRSARRGDGRELYWLARSYEKAGNETGAAKTQKKLADKFPHTYYGVRVAASSGPSAGGTGAIARYETAQDSGGVSAGLTDAARRHYQRARALIDLGMFERAEREIDHLQDHIRKKTSALSWLGRLYIEARAPTKSLRLQALALSHRARKDDFNDPFWRLYFPAAYVKEVEEESARRGVDPYLALAIIRQESAFDRRALSPANARGLMQLLPSTAELTYRTIGLAKQTGAPFTAAALFDPRVNVTLGVAHFAELMRRYHGARVLALAAYNAGRHAVDRWLKNIDPEPEDEFIERIPYSETRGYVKKVIRNQALYREIYTRPSAQRTPDGVVEYIRQQAKEDTPNV